MHGPAAGAQLDRRGPVVGGVVPGGREPAHVAAVADDDRGDDRPDADARTNDPASVINAVVVSPMNRTRRSSGAVITRCRSWPVALRIERGERFATRNARSASTLPVPPFAWPEPVGTAWRVRRPRSPSNSSERVRRTSGVDGVRRLVRANEVGHLERRGARATNGSGTDGPTTPAGIVTVTGERRAHATSRARALGGRRHHGDAAPRCAPGQSGRESPTKRTAIRTCQGIREHRQSPLSSCTPAMLSKLWRTSAVT